MDDGEKKNGAGLTPLERPDQHGLSLSMAIGLWSGLSHGVDRLNSLDTIQPLLKD